MISTFEIINQSINRFLKVIVLMKYVKISLDFLSYFIINLVTILRSFNKRIFLHLYSEIAELLIQTQSLLALKITILSVDFRRCSSEIFKLRGTIKLSKYSIWIFEESGCNGMGLPMSCNQISNHY